MKTTKTAITPEIALSNWLESDESEIENAGYEYYGLPVFELNGREYAVGTDEEADKAAREAIRGSIWAFNASFILGYCGLPLELEEAIKAFQGINARTRMTRFWLWLKNGDSRDLLRRLFPPMAGGILWELTTMKRMSRMGFISTG